MTYEDRVARAEEADRAVLAVLYRAGGECTFIRLYEDTGFNKREIYRALGRQYALGNVKRHRTGEPVVLTASARVAVAAGQTLFNPRPCPAPIGSEAVRSAVAAPRVKCPVPSDEYMRVTDSGREANIRRATMMLGAKIAITHPDRATRGY